MNRIPDVANGVAMRPVMCGVSQRAGRLAPKSAKDLVNAITLIHEQRDSLLAACKHVVAWFERLKDEQHRKLDHSLAEAEWNWPTVGDDTGPLDLQPLIDAIREADPTWTQESAK